MNTMKNKTKLTNFEKLVEKYKKINYISFLALEFYKLNTTHNG